MRVKLNNLLNQKIKYSDDTYFDLFYKLSFKIINWVNSFTELDIYMNNKDFVMQFILFLNDNYYDNNNIIYNDINNYELYDNFITKYNDDIINLYLELKKITKSYGIDLFHNNDNSCLLSEFLYKNIEINDETLYTDYNDYEYDSNDDFDDLFE